jgi:hypothetical protein
VVYLDAEGIERAIPADHVVLAIGSKPMNRLAGPLQSLGIEVAVIGDAREPRGFAEAIAEGFEAALKLGGAK